MSGGGIAPATGVAGRGRAGGGLWPLRRQRPGRVSVTASLVAALALSGCTAGSAEDPAPAPASASTAKWDAASGPATFLAVTERGQLQLRSSADGALLKVIYPASRAGYVSAARLSGNTVLLAHSSACRATLEEVNTATGHRRVVRTVDNAVSGLTVSPDGHTAAFVTTPAPCATPPPGGVDSGGSDAFAAFLPSVLAVTPLDGGPVTTAPTDTPGHPLTHLSWSPDGTRIAATYLGEIPQVLIFWASRPSFATASRLAAPTGCAYFFPVWTRTGLIVAKGCQQPDRTLSPSSLVRLAPGGNANASWPLPACVNGITGAADVSNTHVLLSLGVGYGTDGCDKGNFHRVVMLAGQRLQVVLDVPYTREGLDVVDW